MAIFDIGDEDYLFIEQCYDRTFVPNHNMPNIHSHKGFEIMYVTDGQVCVSVIEDERGEKMTEINLYPGDFIFLESRRFHYISAGKSGARIVNLEVSPIDVPQYEKQRKLKHLLLCDEMFNDFCRSAPETFRLNDQTSIYNTLHLLIRKYIDKGASYTSVDLLLNVLLFDVAALYIKNTEGYRGHTYVRKAVFIIENCLGNIRPDALAAEVGISRIYLHQLFKSCFNRSITEYINEYRIARACNSIQNFPSKKLTDIAAELGFNNILQFERTFKKIKNMTPVAFRGETKNSPNAWISTGLNRYLELDHGVTFSADRAKETFRPRKS